MQQTDVISDRKIKKYSKWLARAAKHGVSLDDLILETRKYHGNSFAERVISKVKNFL